MERKHRIHILYVILAVVGVFWLHDLWQRSQQVAALPYSEFRKLLAEETLDHDQLESLFADLEKIPADPAHPS